MQPVPPPSTEQIDSLMAMVDFSQTNLPVAINVFIARSVVEQRLRVINEHFSGVGAAALRVIARTLRVNLGEEFPILRPGIHNLIASKVEKVLGASGTGRFAFEGVEWDFPCSTCEKIGQEAVVRAFALRGVLVTVNPKTNPPFELAGIITQPRGPASSAAAAGEEEEGGADTDEEETDCDSIHGNSGLEPEPDPQPTGHQTG